MLQKGKKPGRIHARLMVIVAEIKLIKNIQLNRNKLSFEHFLALFRQT